ncbi:hypothetical protein N7603_05460 [Acholeplasma vituli]|uniref:Uncharacterized protein n=1 Tax=Paracholeplasma vituli TaxID=69473 RepID=A0ABT2PVW5_9MOLU|nr:hypothetical protein [Paracholeplasma vituli]MCU0105100.1 hypothetical protein [Paracholeplasma vituli]
MKKSDYSMVDLESTMSDLKDLLIKEHQKYSKRNSTGYEWTGEDFANLYYVNLALLDIVKKQDKMIKNIYDILDRHENRLG